MDRTITLKEVVELAKQLSLVDKVRLIEQITPAITQEIEIGTPVPNPRISLRGLWQGVNITAEEIDAARREMWGTFPREDI